MRTAGPLRRQGRRAPIAYDGIRWHGGKLPRQPESRMLPLRSEDPSASRTGWQRLLDGGVTAASVTAGVAAITAGARVSFPLPGALAPATAQTVAVLLAGVVLGPGRAACSVGLYIALGALGCPVFAGGAGGVSRITGPTGGYLAGFILAAWLTGWWYRTGRCRRLVSAVAGMIVAHGMILAAGWTRLAMLVGPARAWQAGVAPFLVGGIAKSICAGVLAAGFASVAHRIRQAV